MKGTTFQDRSQNFTCYLSVVDGKFAERVKEPSDKTTTRVTKSLKEVHEIYYGSVPGLVSGVEKVDGEYGFQLVIKINDVDEKNQVQVSFYDMAVRTILNKLINVDFSEPITLLVGKNDKGYTWFSVKQAGKGYEKDIVPNAFAKEDFPAPEQVVLQGKPTWVYDGQTDFIWDKLREKLQANPVTAPAPAAANDDWDFPAEPHKPATGTEDLPF
jgi:hypothetical protein